MIIGESPFPNNKDECVAKLAPEASNPDAWTIGVEERQFTSCCACKGVRNRT